VELTDLAVIPDFSNEVLLGLAERLEASHSFQELILREVELDEVYRRVDSAVSYAHGQEDPQAIAALEQVRALVFEAHDLARDGSPLEAAKKLRAAMSLEPRS
jgi:hypothetical protein